MFSSRKAKNLTNRIHERFLRTVYNYTRNTFEELLQLSKSISVQHNIQILITEVYKIVNVIFPPIIKRFFSFRENKYRKFQEMKRYVLETALYRASQLRYIILSVMKSLPNTKLFK